LKAKGSLKFDLSIPTLNTEMTIHNLQVGTLLRSSNLYRKVSAPLEVKLNLSAAGNSISDMTSDLFGNVGFYLGAGKISNKLDATLGMDIGKLFWLSLRGDKNILIKCGKVDLKFKQGIGVSRSLWLNTAQTFIEGTGRIDLVQKDFNVVLNPQPKNPSIFTKNSSIHLSGTFSRPTYKLSQTASKSFTDHECNER